MIVTVAEVGMQLRPYQKGPCWQLYELKTARTNRAGEALPDAWLPVECYPSTLEHGLRIIAERAARRSKVADDLKAAVAEVPAIGDAISRAVSALETRA